MNPIAKKATKRLGLVTELEDLRARFSAAKARENQDENLRRLRAAVKLADPEERVSAERSLKDALATVAAAVKEVNGLQAEIAAAEDALAQLDREVELAQRQAAEAVRLRLQKVTAEQAEGWRRQVLDGLVGLVLYRRARYGPAAVAPSSIVEGELGMKAHPERLMALADQLREQLLKEV